MRAIKRLRRWSAGLIVAFLALPSGLLGQATCPPPTLPEERYRAIVALNAAGCLGSDLVSDQSPLAKVIRASVVAITEFENDSDRRDEVIASVITLLNRVQSAASQVPVDGSGENPTTTAIQRLEELRRALLAGTQVGTSPVQPETWTYEVPGPGELETRGIPVRDWLRAHCSRVPETTDCLAAFGTAQTLVRVSNLVGLLLERLRDPSPLLEDSRLRLARWRSYFGEARSQYPWELWLNDRLTLKEDRVKDAHTGLPRGPRQAPNRQFILLHPDVALEYMADAPEGNQLEEAAYLEVFGFNRWRWNADAEEPMGRAFGASLVVAFSDRAEQDDIGVGLIVHLNNRYSLAVLDHDGATSWLVSVDLAKLWNRVPGAVRDRWVGALELPRSN